MNVFVSLHPGPRPKTHLSFGGQGPLRMENPGLLVPSRPRGNRWVTGRRDEAWRMDKRSRRDVTLDDFNGT